LKLPRCIFTVAERKQSKAVISFEEWNWKSCSAALQFRTPCERCFSFLGHVHLRPFSFILNPKVMIGIFAFRHILTELIVNCSFVHGYNVSCVLDFKGV
jgi:hypothetical protein